jgi:predicted N-acetyltransferase YhbS
MQKAFTFPYSDMRFAHPGDVTELVKLVNSAYRGDHSRLGWTTEADLLEGIRTHPDHMLGQITAPDSVMMVITDSTEAIMACVYLQDKQPLLYLGMLTVKPELQAAGIGRRLLDTAETYARSLGMEGMQMTVISVRDELIAWYARRGYQPTGEKMPFPEEQALGIPRQPIEFVVLEKMF